MTLGRRLVGPDLAEDLVQDSLLVAFNCFHQLTEAEKFGAWLAAIMRNRAIRMRRIANRTQPLPEAEPHCPALIQPPPDVEWVDLHRVIQRLPENYREVIRLYYRDQFDVGEIAVFLQLPVSTIKWQLHSARALLRRQLESL